MKYLSKLLSMLLVGAMLYSTGCTDYDEDIKNVNNRIDELVQSEIEPLKADLDKAVTELEAAIETAKSDILTQHNADIKTLEEAYKAADVKINEALAAVDTKANDATAKAEEALVAIGEANVAIEGLKTADEGFKSDIAAIEADIETMSGDVESLKEIAMQISNWSVQVDSEIFSLKTKIEAIEESIDNLEASVEEIKTVKDELQQSVDSLEEFKATVEEEYKALADADLALETLINNTAEELRGELKDYQDVVRTQFEQAFDDIAKNTTSINALTSELTTKYEELAAVDTAIQNSISEHEQWITNNDAIIKDLQEDLTEIQEALASIPADYTEFQNDVYDRIRNAEGSIGQLQVDVQGLDDKLNEFKVAYDAHIEDYNAFKTSTDEALKSLQTAIDVLINRIQSIVYVPEYTDGKATIDYVTFGEEIIAGSTTVVYQVYPTEGAYAIAEAFKNAEKYPDFNIWFDMQGLKTRANGPELDVVAVKGDASTGRLTVQATAKNFSDSFYLGLATPNEDGEEITDYAISLAVDMGSNEETGSANLSSCFTQITPGKGDAITMRIIYNDQDVTNVESVYTDELTYTNIENNPDFVALPNYKLVFDLKGKTYLKSELHELGYMVNPVYQGSGIYMPTVATSSQLNEETGYYEPILDILKVDAGLIGKTFNLVANWHYGNNNAEKVYAGASLTIIKEQAYVTINTIEDLGTEEFADFSINWNYLKDAAVDAAKLSDKCGVEDDQIGMAEYNRVLAFNLSAVEHNLPEDTTLEKLLNEMTPDEITVKTANAETNVDALQVGFRVLADYGEIYISGYNWDNVYEIEAKYELANVDVNVVFAFETIDRMRKPILVDLGSISNMYASNLVITDEIKDTMEAYIAQTVGAYPINFADITAADYLLDVFVTKPYFECDTDHKTTNTVNGLDASETSTKLVIDNVDGQAIYTTYNYNDSVASKDGYVIDDLDYAKSVTLWYGQKVEFIKDVTFAAPIMMFEKIGNYVVDAYDYENQYNYFRTEVQPKYVQDSKPTTALSEFEVQLVDLNASFDLINVDEDGNKGAIITIPVKDNDPKDGMKRGIAVAENGDTYEVVFNMDDNNIDGNIVMQDNHIAYYGRNEEVNVDADLYLLNDNETKMWVRTNFNGYTANDNFDDFTNYRVKKFNPVHAVAVDTSEVATNEATKKVIEWDTYTIDLMKVFTLKDKRGVELFDKNRTSFTDPMFIKGNGENGFWEGITPDVLYGTPSFDNNGLVDVNVPFAPIKVWFEFGLTNEGKRLESKGLLKPMVDDGAIIFHYTSENDLKVPIVIDVTIHVDTAWEKSKWSKSVTFIKGSYDETTAE